MPNFFLFPPILNSTEASAFLYCDFLEYCPRGQKKLNYFHMFVFSGVHVTTFGVLEHVVNAVKCLYHRDTKLEVRFICFLYNEPTFSLAKKVVQIFHQV